MLRVGSVLGLLPLAVPQPVPDSGNGFAFSVYYPEFVQQPLEQYIETSHGGMVQPSLALGGNASHPVLITQDFSSHPLRSLDGGLTWSPLCATTTTAAAGALCVASTAGFGEVEVSTLPVMFPSGGVV